MKRLRGLLPGLVVVLALGLYLYAARVQLLTVNTDRGRSDQGAYMGYAIKLKESGYSYVGDRNRMPLFPILSSTMYREGMGDDEFFLRGKWFNVALSVVLLAALWAIFRRHLPVHGAVNLLAITAFDLFAFKAPCFQGELLYYTLSFVGFWLLSRVLARPRPVLGVLAGIALAAAHYTKASVLPGLLVFLAVSLASLLWALRDRVPSLAARMREVLRSRLVSAGALCLCAFLGILAPYLIHSEEQYGRFFYNVNTTFYAWYDTWDQAKEGTRAHGDRRGWPNMPEDQIPSPARYLQKHSLRDIVRREANGIWVLLRDRVNSYGYLKYAAGAWPVAVVLAVRRRDLVRGYLARYRWVALYWIAFLVSYFLMYAWWVPISPAPRLVLSLFVPYMWAISLAIDRLLVSAPSLALGGRSISPRTAIDVVVSAVVVVDAVLVATGRIAQHYGCT